MLAEQFQISARELELVVGPLGIVAHFPLAKINQLGAQFLMPFGQHEVRVPFIAESPERLRSPHLLLAHRWTPLLRMYPSEWTMFTCTTHCREYPLPLRRGKGIGGVGSYDRPTISPSSSRSILAAAGDADRPGMVRMSPQMGYTKPAPADARTSRTGSVQPVGAPFSAGSEEIDRCVLAMHTGRRPNPARS